jgi:flagellar motor protein MotB
MTRNRNLIVTGLVVCFVAATAMAQNKDAAGSKDHPLISRYPGSYIREYMQKEYDEFTLPLGKLVDQKFTKSQHLEGKVTSIIYQAPAGRSMLEVFRNYQGALRNGGFTTLFTCASRECNEGGPCEAKLYSDYPECWTPDRGVRYLSAKLARPEGDVYVSVFTEDGGDYGPPVRLYVVEMKPMESELITVNAASLANDITRTGHASVYGIYFDTGKADVKPESDATLKEIAKLLQQNAKLKLHVVGHTDNVGTLASNMDLSRKRADAVAKVLTTKYNIAASRLSAQGVGPLAPVGSNKTEDGRAKNRRVELVEQ